MSDNKYLKVDIEYWKEKQQQIEQLKDDFKRVDDAAEYWKEQFETLFNEVNEHKVLADVLRKWEGESDELDEINE